MSAFSGLTAALRIDRHSLRWKLPWLFALTAVLTVAAFGVFAYGHARSLAIETATTRLRSTLSQVRTVSELGVANQLTALRTIGYDAEVVKALRTGTVSDSATRALRTLKGVSDSSVLVELIDRDGTVLKVLPEAAASVGQQRTIDAPLYASIGPMRESGGAASFEATISVTSGGDALGRLRVVRQQRQGVNRRMAANLLEGAVLLVGNADGTLWGPSGQVQYPVVVGTKGHRYLRDGERWLSVSTPVPNTPWLYALDLPERIALAPANDLIFPFVVTGILIALAGAFIGFSVSRRITNPLSELTAAAETIARGGRDVRLAVIHRRDEIGRLARAFDTMTSSVTNVRDRLEAEVDARTGELSTAAARLRALHEELKESEKLASLGRLSGSVGHELRNPLGVMSNVVFLIDNLAVGSDKLREYARLLREQIRVSDRIISDLLDRARSGPPVRHVVDVATLLDDVILRADVPPSIRVERAFSALIPRLLLDRDHLAQILWNLVTNAIQAMHGREGLLTIAATVVDARLRIEVRDSGDGIAPSDVDRIFEPMYTTKAHGIGLGLSVSRAFARANGGDLFARATGQGACFVLDLPATVAVEDESDGERASPVRHRTPPSQVEST